jgi:hypothetical protein
MTQPSQQLLCFGDIHWAGGKVYEHKSAFPAEAALAAYANEQVAIAKKQGVTDDASLAEIRALAAEDFDAEVARLVSIGSLKKPEDLLPASDLAEQLRAAQERIADLEARQLAEAGIPASVANNKAAKQAATTPTPTAQVEG